MMGRKTAGVLCSAAAVLALGVLTGSSGAAITATLSISASPTSPAAGDQVTATVTGEPEKNGALFVYVHDGAANCGASGKAEREANKGRLLFTKPAAEDVAFTHTGTFAAKAGPNRICGYLGDPTDEDVPDAGATAVVTGTAPATPPPATSQPRAGVTSTLTTPAKKEIAMKLVSSAENSSLNWKAQYKYIEDIRDGRGYTAGIIGFCSGTGDMLDLVRYYKKLKPRRNRLVPFLPALRRVNGTASHRGLGRRFVRAWRAAAKDSKFRRAQNRERDRVYFNPAVGLALRDGLNALGQFAYYDAAVVHGTESSREGGITTAGLEGIRKKALARAASPAAGGSETAYLEAFLDERVIEMKKEKAHEDVTRIEKAQRKFLREGNLHLNPPLRWSVYGDPYSLTG